MENEKESKNATLCPSYVAKPGAKLFGVINQKGETEYMGTALEVQDAFLKKVSNGRTPEKRFRFAGNCAKKGCKQWNGKACGLIDDVVDLINNPPSAKLQACAIREECRWYSQRGATACAQCSEVIRNIETKVLQDIGAIEVE